MNDRSYASGAFGVKPRPEALPSGATAVVVG
jgi:hypothetical protein